MTRATGKIISLSSYLASIAPLQNPGPEEATTLTFEQQRELTEAISECTRSYLWTQGTNAQIANHLRVAFRVAHLEDIPAAYFGAALELVRSKREAAASFLRFISEKREWFGREVLGGGAPWTPAIKSKLTQELGRSVVLPPRVDWLALAEAGAGPRAPRQSEGEDVMTHESAPRAGRRARGRSLGKDVS